MQQDNGQDDPELAGGLRVVSQPGIGVSITCNLGDSRQIVVQTHYPQAATKAEANAVVDRMFDLVDRKKAEYEIPALENELAQVEIGLKNFHDNRSLVEQTYLDDQARRKNRIGECEKEISDAFDAGYAEHNASKKQGEYKPSGARKSKIEALTRESLKLRDEIEDERKKRDKLVSETDLQQKQFERRIENIQADIAKRLKIVHGEGVAEAAE